MSTAKGVKMPEAAVARKKGESLPEGFFIVKVSTARPRPPTMSSWSHSSSPGGDKVPTSATYESSWTQSSCLVGDNIDTNIGQL